MGTCSDNSICINPCIYFGGYRGKTIIFQPKGGYMVIFLAAAVACRSSLEQNTEQ